MFEDQINRALKVKEHQNNVREHFYCVKEIFEIYKTKEQLQTLQARADVDTICAWDYNRMKSFALGSGLDYADFVPAAQGVNTPQL